jgi:hypothetical protein
MLTHKGRIGTGAIGLVGVGPMVRIVIHPPSRAPLPSEPAIPAHLMVDTGAHLTCLREDYLQQAGLAPIRVGSMVGVSGKPELCPVYRACIEIGMADPQGNTMAGRFVADVYGVKALGHVDGLLGRDFLRHFRFVYNGPDGTFEIIDQNHGSQPLSHERPSPATAAKTKAKKKKAEADRRKNRHR